MKRNILSRLLVATLCAGWIVPTACSDDNATLGTGQTDESDARAVTVHLNASPMEGWQEASSRAASPMLPEMENTIRTLAVFQFDAENLHNANRDFQFIDFTEESAEGVLETTTQEILFNYADQDKTTVCFVANVTAQDENGDPDPESDVYKFYREALENSGTRRQIDLDEFKAWVLALKYANDKETGDQTGHLTAMPMFGYFEGNLTNKENDLSIAMGRLASRIEIILEGGEGMSGEVSYHFDNLEKAAYVFPGGISVSQGDEAEKGYFETSIKVEEIQSTAIRYFYIAGRGAEKAGDATTLHLSYDGKEARVPLCNTPPTETDHPNYNINRNSIYRFRIRVKDSSASTTRSASSASPTWQVAADGVAEIEVTF